MLRRRMSKTSAGALKAKKYRRRHGSVSPDAVEAAKLQQQGDKKAGQGAADAYEKAVAKYEDAQNRYGLTAEEQMEIFMGKGDSYQKWAESVLYKMHGLSNDELTVEAERRARKRAESLYQLAIDEYQKTDTGSCGMDFNACVNCGNSFSAWADLCDPRECVRHSKSAVEHYRMALMMDGEDTEVWQNLGDVLVQLGRVMHEIGSQAECEETFAEALEAYSKSCSLSDSRKGDDLPGLLQNWAIGLIHASECTVDLKYKAQYIEEAIKRLQDAVGFKSDEPALFTALGDALASKSTLLDHEDGMDMLGRSLTDGYEAAMKISKGNPDSVLGMAEVHMQMGKMCKKVDDDESAFYHFTKSADIYGHALGSPQALGGFRERCEAQYNYACACALSDRGMVAHMVLKRLMKVGGINAKEVSEDPDFEIVREEPWFQRLLVEGGLQS